VDDATETGGCRKPYRVSKLEYQLSRPIFLRLVWEYTTERQAALRDDTRTGAPILIFDAAAGTYVRAEAFGRLFAGYGSTLRDPTELGRASLRRSADGFFLKLSYLFQM